MSKLKKKFTEEARALFKMKHPGIVQVIDIFEENGTAYYAMEFIEGKSLNEAVKQRGKLPEAEAVGYVLQVAEALKYVHSLNRLHLDLKPGNIMLNKEGKAVIIDFGASKHYDTETGENTSTLLRVNTKRYAPVEQVNQSFTTFSPATVIYALGATLYKLLTGITPPPSTVLHAEEATLTPLPSIISASTRQAVNAAMQLLRKNRTQTIEEWVNTFRNNNSHQEDEKTEYTGLIKPHPQPKHTLQPTSQAKPKKKKWLFLSAIVAALVVSCLIGIKFNPNRSLDYYAQTNFLFVICLSVFRLQWNPIAPSKRRDI